MPAPLPVDICLVLEGTYPYVAGGVSHWTDNLLRAQKDLTFHLVCLSAPGADLTPRYDVPPNVVGITHITVGKLRPGARRLRGARQFFERLEAPLLDLQGAGGLDHMARLMRLVAPDRTTLGRTVLLDSPEGWDLLLRMYRAAHADSAFLDYFWTWRSILGGFYSVLLAGIPQARVYHALSTGYAGLFAARASLETGRPMLLTEHGIYTNERRIEIALADWLYQAPGTALQVEGSSRDLKAMWVNTFAFYSRVCYEAASRIITLYEGNRQLQLEDGASPDKLEIIPNGVDYLKFSAAAAARSGHPPTVALIGRVVPIKDVKTYIRAVAILRDLVPDIRALVLGPTDENPQYFAESKSLVQHLGLQGCFTFMGHVPVQDHLPDIDVIVLTSISEAQPLVILEAGAAGVPAVATDVGACREMIYGDRREADSLGAGGEVTPLANPTATAIALARLLGDPEARKAAGRAIRERVRRYYDKPALDRAYRRLYDRWAAAPPVRAFSQVS